MSRNLNWTSADLAAVKSGAKLPKQKAQTSQLRGAEAIEARRKAMVLIGIDPGTNTGLAMKRDGKFTNIETVSIWQALNFVHLTKHQEAVNGKEIFVRIEDARLRTYFGKTDREKLQGAGSIKRDCAIWEEVLTDLQISFEFVHPKNVKATTAEYFKAVTGWTGRTSIHAREAASLIL